MNVLEITSKRDLEAFDVFVQSHAYGSLHQTRKWAEFQKAARHHRYFILGVLEGKSFSAAALVMSIPLPFGKKYFYTPRGPIFDPDDKASLESCEAILKELRKRAKHENAIYLRVDPSFAVSEEKKQFFKSHSFRRAHVQHQPELTIKVDLKPDEDQILSQMKPKGRYNIKIAEKHGVVISENTDASVFYTLLQETTKRDKFHGHPESYYKKMLEMLGSSCKLFVAHFQNKPIAAAITTYFKDTATYYYGASSNEHRNTMAPYLLHWEIMRDAKRKGFAWYDFFGIAPANEPDHPWATISDFKRKFGGIEEQYIGAWERMYQPLAYHAMKIAKKLRH